MDTTQLKCPACGSTDLEELRWNEYKCSYCGSVLSLDSQGERLELTGWVCPQCGFNNAMGQRFCGQCGSKLVRACLRCEAENALNMRYCGSCGFDYMLCNEFQLLETALRKLQQELHGFETARAERGKERQSRREQNLRREIAELEEVRDDPPPLLAEWIQRRQAEDRRREAEEARRRSLPWYRKPNNVVLLILGGGMLLLCMCCALSAITGSDRGSSKERTPDVTATIVPRGRSAVPTSAVSTGGHLRFMEGSNCTQDVVGELTDAAGQSINLKQTREFTNDEARSVLLVNVRRGTLLRVYDHPQGKETDDWAEFAVKETVGEYCITSFEQTYEDAVVEAILHRKNGLDGKVSRIEILAESSVSLQEDMDRRGEDLISLTPEPGPTYTLPFAPTPTATIATRSGHQVAMVVPEELNLRRGPGTEYGIEQTLGKGDELEILAKAPDGIWVRVVAPNGTEGWVHSEYVAVPQGVIDQLPVIQPVRAPTRTPTSRPTKTPAVVESWKGVHVGMPADDVLRIHPKSESVEEPEILGSDVQGLVVRWSYSGAYLVLARRWGECPEGVDSSSCDCYRVTEIHLW